MSNFEKVVFVYLVIGLVNAIVRYISYVHFGPKSYRRVRDAVRLYFSDVLLWWVAPLKWLYRLVNDTRGRVSPPFIYRETWHEYHVALQQLRKVNRDKGIRIPQLQRRGELIHAAFMFTAVQIPGRPLNEAGMMELYSESLRNIDELDRTAQIKTEEDLLKEFREKEAARVERERRN